MKKPLYSYTEVCVHVSGGKPQHFTVGVGFRQECALSTLHFESVPQIN